MRKEERIGDNIFKGEIKEIYPDIFSDDENVYYLDVYEDWAKQNKNNPFSLMKKLVFINYQEISEYASFDKKTVGKMIEKVADINFERRWKYMEKRK